MSTRKDKFSSKDKLYMDIALKLAKSRYGHTGSNPSVGCVIVKNNQLLGEGWHNGDNPDTWAALNSVSSPGSCEREGYKVECDSSQIGVQLEASRKRKQRSLGSKWQYWRPRYFELPHSVGENMHLLKERKSWCHRRDVVAADAGRPL